MATLQLDESINYFTCTLGEAAILNARYPHPFKTVRNLLDNLAEYYPKYAAVGFFEPSSNGDNMAYSVYGYESLRKTALQTAARIGFPQGAPSDNRAVALIGKSSRAFFFVWLGLVATGYKLLLLSPDLDADAIAHLCQQSEAFLLIYDQLYQSLAASVETTIFEKGNIIRTCPLPTAESITDGPEAPENDTIRPISEEDVAYYHHSSGTSGLPKLLPVSHKMAIGVLPRLQTGHPMNAMFTTTPMYHGGPADCFRAWSAVSLIWLYPGEIPITAASILKCMGAAKFASMARKVPDLAYFSCVPQVLILLTEHPKGIAVLRDDTKLVGVGGAAMPEQLGNELVGKGINLVSRFGSAECGFLLSSNRAYSTDKEWQFLRRNPSVKSVAFESRGEGLYELIALNSWPAFAKTNRADGSFATSDLFRPHLTISNAWKYDSRSDSQITLVTGKKFDPAPLEDWIRESPLIDDILIFGANRHYPGALLIPSAKGMKMPNEDFLRCAWTLVELQNVKVPKHAQLARSMLKTVSNQTIRLPKSSKGTTLRPKAEALCQREIEVAYSSEQFSQDSVSVGEESTFDPHLNEGQVTQQVFNIVKKVKGGFKELSMTNDLYNQGVDSNDCIKIISMIQKRLLPPNSRLPPSDMVYHFGNIINLASQITALREGTARPVDDQGSKMWELVAQYGTWRAKFTHCTDSEHAVRERRNKQVFLLTGATGTLGAHILSQLSIRGNVAEIHCLIRGENEAAAKIRLLEALLRRQLPLPEDSFAKIYCHPCKLSEPNLGLTDENYAELADHVTHIIHAAWPVNFALRLESFVQESIVGLNNLIQLALASCRSTPPHFVFCSSTASVIGSYDEGEAIPEEISSDTHGLSPMGYARSKWVAESICDAAHHKTDLQNHISVVRIGQLCGDTLHGVWNETEAFPLMISSSKVTGSFPRLSSEPLKWLPFNIAAAAVLDIAETTPNALESLIHELDEITKHEIQPCRVFNLLEMSPTPTTDDLVDWVKELSPRTKIVPPEEWVEQLENLRGEVADHPALKLLNFWKQAYSGQNDGKSWSTLFAIGKTMRASPVMREYVPIGEEQFIMMWDWIEKNVGK